MEDDKDIAVEAKRQLAVLAIKHLKKVDARTLTIFQKYGIFDSIKPNYQVYLDNLKAGLFYKKTSRDIVENAILETSQIDPKVTYSDFKICDAFDTLDKTNTIDVPCLIICGKYDHLTPLKYSQFFHDKIKNSELHIIDKASHGVMLEKPDKVNQAIKDFINNNL